MYLLLLLGICALAYGAGGDEVNEIQRQPLPNSLTDNPRYRRGLRSLKVKVSDNIKTKVSGLKEKYSKFKSDNPAVLRIIEKLNNTVGDLNDTADNMEKLEELVSKVEENWKDLTEGDAIAIAKSVVDIVGTVAGFLPPPVGTIASTIFGIVGGILGIFGGGGAEQKGVGDIVKEVMVKELKRQYIDEMNDNIRGAVEYLQLNKVFLSTYTGGNVTSQDFNFMINYFDHLRGLELKGQLASLIARLGRSYTSEDAKDTIKLVESYVVLTSMIELLMHTMKSILEENPETPKSALSVGLIIQEARLTTKTNLKFLRNPMVENGIAAAHYVPAEHPTVEKMLDALGVKTPFNEGCYKMVNKHWNRGVHLRLDTTGLETSDSENTNTVLKFINNTISNNSSTMRGTWNIQNKGELLCGGNAPNYGIMFHRESQCYRDLCNRTSCPTSPFRIYPFSDMVNGYMLVHAIKPKNPLYLQTYPKTGDGYVTPAPNPEDHPWTEGKQKDNPSYVWLLTKVDCV